MTPIHLPPFYPIVDAGVAAQHGWTPPAVATACFDGGARLVQLRAAGASSAQTERWCEAIVASAARYRATVIVNDRADIGHTCGAGGVHVGQDDLPAGAVRDILGPAAIIGLSTHTEKQLDDAWSQPVSYVAVGPVYGTQTKATGYAPVGLSLVRAAAARRPAHPIVAIGGITLDCAPELIAAGAASVAVIGDLFRQGSPEARTRAYVDQLADCAPPLGVPLK